MAQSGVDAKYFSNLFADSHQRVHGTHRLLKDNADLTAMQFPKLTALRMEKVLPVEQDVAGIAALLPWEKTGNAHGGHGFPAAAFPDKTDDFSVMNGQRNPADRIPVAVVEADVQITDYQHLSPPHCLLPVGLHR